MTTREKLLIWGVLAGPVFATGLFLGLVVAFASQQDEPLGAIPCPVVAEITDKERGTVNALTKGDGECVDIADYIVSSYKAGVTPVVDISQITGEEWGAALQTIVTDFEISSEERNLARAVRGKLVERGERVEAVKEDILNAEVVR